AASHGLTVAPHLWGGAVLFASGLHLAVATPCVTTLEFSRGENPLLHDLIEEPFELTDGSLIPSERPGLGITLRRDFVRSITVAQAACSRARRAPSWHIYRCQIVYR